MRQRPWAPCTRWASRRPGDGRWDCGDGDHSHRWDQTTIHLPRPPSKNKPRSPLDPGMEPMEPSAGAATAWAEGTAPSSSQASSDSYPRTACEPGIRGLPGGLCSRTSSSVSYAPLKFSEQVAWTKKLPNDCLGCADGTTPKCALDEISAVPGAWIAGIAWPSPGVGTSPTGQCCISRWFSSGNFCQKGDPIALGGDN